MRREGCLLLEDGLVLEGGSVGAPRSLFREAVFTTAMSGYKETVTDPRFGGQIITFTAPMIANYGVVPGQPGVAPAYLAARGLRARSGQFHPEAGSRPHYGWSIFADSLRS